MSMAEENVIPIWKKTGIIPEPSMPADRINSGLLLSMVSRIAIDYSSPTSSFLYEVERLLSRVISDHAVIEFHDDASYLYIDIMTGTKGLMYGYTLYFPIGWFGKKHK